MNIKDVCENLILVNSKMKKIAFLFLTKDTLNRVQLWNKYFKGHEEQYSIYIHPYSYYNTRNKPHIKDRLVRDNIIDTIVKTDYYHVVGAILELFKVAIQDKDNYKFILVTESDIPIISFNKMYKKMTADNKSFFKILEVDPRNDWVNRIKPALEAHKVTGQYIINPNKFIKHNPWYCLNRKHLKQVLKSPKEYLELFKTMDIGNEHILTLLNIANKDLEKQIHNEKTTYVDWSECQSKADEIWKKYKNNKPELKKRLADVWSHPKTFNKLDKGFISRCRSTGWVTLRKVI